MSPPFVAVEEIFFAALEHADPSRRAAYLDEACGSNHELRSQVERLLAAETKVQGFLEEPAVPSPSSSSFTTVFEEDDVGGSIGPYRRLEQIGEGGMGVVYLAEQTVPVRRRVALKIIKPGMDTKQVVARFEAERQALAMMDHPNIARVLDTGATPLGRPYFVMELVGGIPITAFCDGERLGIRERLELFVAVCQAVQHAHQKGIIHRDLKPSNILVTRIDGAIVPKVIDFGVAKAVNGQLTERTLDTGLAQLVGTPLYMSPEQAGLTGVDIDTRTDIYSLGVLLYELLTGLTPFDPERIRGAGFDEVRRVVLDREPTRPSTRLCARGTELESIAASRRADARRLTLALRGDLDWIVMKALEKDRRRRYDTAGAFAADVVRYLADQPVEASPPSTWYGFTKYARRHRVPLTTTALVVLALIVGTVVSVWQAVRATRAERQTAQALAVAQSQGRLAERHLYAAQLRQAGDALERGSSERAQEILALLRPGPDEPESRGFAWWYLWHAARRELGQLGVHEAEISAMVLSPDGRLLATGDDVGTILLWDVASDRLHARLTGHRHDIRGLAFSADGRVLASVDQDQSEHSRVRQLRVWDAATGGQLAAQDVVGQSCQGLSFTATGDRLVTVWVDQPDRPREVKVFDVTPGRGLVLAGSRQFAPEEIHLTGPLALAKSLNGNLVVLDFRTFERLWTVPETEHGLNWRAFSDGGRWVHTGDGLHADVYEAANGRVRAHVTVGRPGREAKALHLSQDGTKLLVQYDPVSVSLFHLDREQRDSPREIPLRIPGEHRSLETVFARDGMKVAVSSLRSDGGQGPVMAWDTTDGRLLGRYPGHRVPSSRFAFSVDGKALFIKGGSTMYRWALEGPRHESLDVLAGHSDEAWAAAFSPRGELLATGSDDTDELQTIKLWDTTTGQLRLGWRGSAGRGSKRVAGTVSALAFAPDGSALVSAHLENDHQVRVWDPSNGKLRATFRGHTGWVRTVAYHPGGGLIASGGDDGTVRLWNAAGSPVWTRREHLNKVRQVAFSPDGQTLASVGNDDMVRLWDVASGRQVDALRNSCHLTSVVFSPDGRMLAAADDVGTIVLWEPRTGAKQSRRLHSDDGELRCLIFSPNGRTLATAGMAGTVRLWDPLTGQELLALKGKGVQVNGLSFSPDGRTLAATSHDGTVRLWHADTHAR